MEKIYNTYEDVGILARLGKILSWIASTLAIIYLIIGGLVAQEHPGGWVLFFLVILIPAILLWACGRLLRYVLAGF